MPTLQPSATSPAQVPTPVSITPALLKTHSITPAEYTRIEAALGRTPSLTELGIFSVMWSEHCSYKSSRVHLKRLPTRGTRTSGPGSVIQGPGENAGIIDVGDGWACAFKIESHNHPSYIEPYQGAATGVGGILRDIFTMGARPLAVMDSLRFGPLSPPEKNLGSSRPESSQSEPQDLGSSRPESSQSEPQNLRSSRPESSQSEDVVERPPNLPSSTPAQAPDPTDYARNRQTLTGVVHGVGGYGNCFGVPNLGGETRFEPCYSGNPLVNAFALGLVRTDEIFYAKAEGIGNPVFYVGAKTGRDGIHGATMASEEFTEGSEQKRPNVQMGDPFLEKLLLEACLEVMKTGAVLGIQDMGAAGLTCSTCEMGARGHLGVTIELDRVPQRETGMSTYEIMLSESQERMLLVAEKGREAEVIAVFTKWGLDCAEVGIVTADDVMRVYHGGVLEAEIPNPSLTDDAPLYNRPVGTWTPPVPKDPPAWVLEELKKPRDYTADLKKLLASPNICSKHWIYEQYDSMVQTNTVQGPGSEAGVIRIKPHVGHATNPGAPHLASEMWDGPPQSSGGNPNASHKGTASAVPSITHENGASAPEATPPKPERGLAMALAGNGRWCYLDPKLGAMHAVAEAARKVACTGATPVAATNCLNFGNPEKPEIMAQLSAAIDGIAEACTALNIPVTGGNVSLYNETKGEGIYPTPVIGVVGILDDVTKAIPNTFQREGELVFVVMDENVYPEYAPFIQFGSSEYVKTIFDVQWGTPPLLPLQATTKVNGLLESAAAQGLITCACDIGSGGLAVALAKASFAKQIGAEVKAYWDTQPAQTTWGKFSPISYFDETPSVLITCSPEKATQVIRHFTVSGVTACPEIGRTTADGMRLVTSTWDSGVLRISELRTAYSGALESQLTEEVLA